MGQPQSTVFTSGGLLWLETEPTPSTTKMQKSKTIAPTSKAKLQFKKVVPPTTQLLSTQVSASCLTKKMKLAYGVPTSHVKSIAAIIKAFGKMGNATHMKFSEESAQKLI